MKKILLHAIQPSYAERGDTVRIDVQKLNSAEAAMACLVMFDVTNPVERAHTMTKRQVKSEVTTIKAILSVTTHLHLLSAICQGGSSTGFPARALLMAWRAVRPCRRPVAMTEVAAA